MTFSHILNQNDGHSMPSFFKAFFFILFNFTMQVVLLNLLIALMGEAREGGDGGEPQRVPAPCGARPRAGGEQE